MTKFFLIQSLMIGFMVNVAAQPFQLSEPILCFDEVLFQGEMEVDAKLGLEGVILRYSLDNADVNGGSQIMKSPLLITDDGILKVRAFHPDFMPSNTISTHFRKIGRQHKIRNINLLSEVHDSYQGIGTLTLMDLKKGSNDFQDKRWLGFKGQNVGLEIELVEARSDFDVLVGLLYNPGAWIIGPKKIILYAGKEDGQWQKIDVIDTELHGDGASSFNDFLKLEGKSPFKTNRIKLELVQHVDAVDWHPGTPENIWIFIDEIIIK